MAFGRKDKALDVSFALPSSGGDANATTSNSIVVGDGAVILPIELYIGVPSLSATELPSGETLTITVEESDDNSSFSVISGLVYTVTGTGSTVAASSLRLALPSTVKKYVRVKVTGSASIGDMSGKDLTVEIVG